MLLQLKNIKYSYGAERIIDIDNFTLKKGEHSLVIGNSGVGKTTFTNIVSGLLKPQDGEVVINGQNLYIMLKSQRDKFRANEISVIFQESLLNHKFTIKENFDLIINFSNSALKQKEILELSNFLELDNYLTKYPQDLSKIDLKKILILRALLSKPSIIIIDNIIADLDDIKAEEICGLLIELANKIGATCIVTTNNSKIKKKFKHKIIL